MLGETLREVALVILAAGLVERIFSDRAVRHEDVLLVLGVSTLAWLSGAYMEEHRKE
jgi:hypothetical protein